jgi:hypothetical protein
VVFVAACPGGHERRARKQVTLVVVAGPVGQDEVLHSIHTAADTGDEVICLRPDAKRSPAVEAAVRLQRRDAFPQWLGGISRSDPNRWRWRSSSAFATPLISAADSQLAVSEIGADQQDSATESLQQSRARVVLQLESFGDRVHALLAD